MSPVASQYLAFTSYTLDRRVAESGGTMPRRRLKQTKIKFDSVSDCGEATCTPPKSPNLAALADGQIDQSTSLSRVLDKMHPVDRKFFFFAWTVFTDTSSAE
jgi:hypothetical protein